jgi:hypothetical protein
MYCNQPRNPEYFDTLHQIFLWFSISTIHTGRTRAEIWLWTILGNSISKYIALVLSFSWFPPRSCLALVATQKIPMSGQGKLVFDITHTFHLLAATHSRLTKYAYAGVHKAQPRYIQVYHVDDANIYHPRMKRYLMSLIMLVDLLFRAYAVGFAVALLLKLVTWGMATKI